MRCPFCGQDNDKVIDSRASDGGRSIRRRREHVEENSKLAVIKKDGSRVPYSRDKVLEGVSKACYKRPVSAEQVSKLVDEVEEEIFRGEREVEAVLIGRAVADRLKRVDQVAYVRFASVY